MNSVTHAPIARALVTYGTDFAVLTDNDGHFEFTATSPDSGGGGSHGIYRPIARKPGFFDAPNGWQIESSATELTIPLVPEAIIKGHIALPSKDPASQITVQLYTRRVENGFFRWQPEEIVQANSNGEFRFAELQAGYYKVLTREFMDNDPIDANPDRLFGYPPVYFPNAADFPSATTIQVSAGETFQADISLVRRPYYPVQIPVVNPDLAPGLAISVLPHGHSSPGYSLGYNFVKKRIDGQLPDGNYEVEAFGFHEQGASGMTNLTVAGAPAENSSMVLHPNGSIAINVREEFTANDQPHTASWNDGQNTFTYKRPRAYLQAYAESADDFDEQRRGSLRSPTQGNDSLVIDNLQAGRYWLRLDTSVGYVASATMGGLDLFHQPFEFGAGSSTPIEITMRDDFAGIEGTVAGVVGASPASEGGYGTVGGGPGSSKFLFGFPGYIYCIPLPDSPGQFQQIGINSDGKFSSQTIPPGTYRILAFKQAQNNLPYRDAEAMKAYDSKGQVVHLSSGQKTTVELQLINEAD